MRNAVSSWLLVLSSLAAHAEECKPVVLDRAHSVIDGDGSVWHSNYSIPACSELVLDVSAYVQGGADLKGRDPPNFVEVVFIQGQSSIYLRHPLEQGEHLVRVMPSQGVLEQGESFSNLEAGQWAKVRIGIEQGDRYEEYFLSSINID